MKRALIFGSIGTIVETSEMQLEAFNAAFAEAELGWDWNTEDYRKMLKKSGGQQRIEDYAETRGEIVDARALHLRKTELFDDMMKQRGLQPRDGVLETISAAKEAGFKIGFATTTQPANIAAIFEALDGALLGSHFDFVGHAGRVTKGKPDPEIFHLALREMGASASLSLAIEDTGVAYSAAVAAGLDCVAFANAFADKADFPADAKIVKVLSADILPTTDAQAA